MINILCLHGCNQSEDMLRSILKTLIKIGNKCDIQFHFIQAMYEHSLGGYTWYEKELDVSEIGNIQLDGSMISSCMKQVHEYITKHDITVLLGFSQGGNVVDTYLNEYPDSPINRALIFSGYELVNQERKKLKVPLLSFYSEMDDIVPSKHRPSNYQVLYEEKHLKGHRFPTGNPLLRKICCFINDGSWVVV